MTIELYVPKNIEYRAASIKKFLQQMIMRLSMGDFRYGPPKKSQKYMTRLLIEAKAYKQKGNSEQLRNIANYCWLENEAPENPKFHYDDKVDSATRGKL